MHFSYYIIYGAQRGTVMHFSSLKSKGATIPALLGKIARCGLVILTRVNVLDLSVVEPNDNRKCSMSSWRESNNMWNRWNEDRGSRSLLTRFFGAFLGVG